MICIVCRTKFYDSSFSAPAEPCDCGLCWGARLDDLTPRDHERLADLRARWSRGETFFAPGEKK